MLKESRLSVRPFRVQPGLNLAVFRKVTLVASLTGHKKLPEGATTFAFGEFLVPSLGMPSVMNSTSGMHVVRVHKDENFDIFTKSVHFEGA